MSYSKKVAKARRKRPLTASRRLAYLLRRKAPTKEQKRKILLLQVRLGKRSPKQAISFIERNKKLTPQDRAAVKKLKQKQKKLEKKKEIPRGEKEKAKQRREAARRVQEKARRCQEAADRAKARSRKLRAQSRKLEEQSRRLQEEIRKLDRQARRVAKEVERLEEEVEKLSSLEGRFRRLREICAEFIPQPSVKRRVVPVNTERWKGVKIVVPIKMFVTDQEEIFHRIERASLVLLRVGVPKQALWITSLQFSAFGERLVGSGRVSQRCEDEDFQTEGYESSGLYPTREGMLDPGVLNAIEGLADDAGEDTVVFIENATIRAAIPKT